MLVRMHTRIIPHMASPLLLADFLFRVLDAGGLLGMLALHGIFTLVTKHGLEYPHFYPRLYRLLTPASLMVIYYFSLSTILQSGQCQRDPLMLLQKPQSGASGCIHLHHPLLHK